MREKHRLYITGSFFIGVLLALFIPTLNGQEAKSSSIQRPQQRKVVKYVSKVDENASLLVISKNKIDFIQAMVQSYVDFKDDITNQTIINQIYDLIGAEFPIDGEHLKKKPDNRSVAELKKVALEMIKKIYPKEGSEYKKELEATAAKIYANSRKGDKITLTYTKGRSRYKITDIFYRFNGSTVSIGLKTIPFYDLIEEDKIKVSPAYAQRKRNEYVTTNLTEYLEKRRDALLSKETELERRQLEDNIKNGFVKHQDVWKYPIQVVNYEFNRHFESNPQYKGKVKSLDLTSTHRSRLEYTRQIIDKVKLAQKVDARKAEAAKRVGTIDSEQGFINVVFWGFSREETKMLLEAQGINYVPGKEYDKAIVSNRQIVENRLYYENDQLVKVVTVYEIRDTNAFTLLRQNMIQKYGTDDKTRNNQYVLANDSLTWTGNVTDGLFYIKMSDIGKYEEISLTLKRVSAAEQKKRMQQEKRRK